MAVNMQTLGKGLAGHFGFCKKIESGLFWAGDRTSGPEAGLWRDARTRSKDRADQAHRGRHSEKSLGLSLQPGQGCGPGPLQPSLSLLVRPLKGSTALWHLGQSLCSRSSSQPSEGAEVGWASKPSKRPYCPLYLPLSGGATPTLLEQRKPGGSKGKR